MPKQGFTPSKVPKKSPKAVIISVIMLTFAAVKL